MKIGVVSDSHRNTDLLLETVDWLINKKKIAALYHLGDDYQDVAILEEKYIDIVQVPGIYHPNYRDGSLKAKALETVLGLRILLVHSLEKDFTEEDKISADIIFHGHTHKHEIHVDDGQLYVNPGHLKGPKDKNMDPSFVFCDIQDKTVSIVIYNTSHEEIDSIELLRSENGLYKAT